MADTKQTCPICGQENSELIRLFPSSWDYLLIDYLRDKNPAWDPSAGICSRCLDQVQAYYLSLATAKYRGDGSPGEINGYKVLPTPWRLLAHPDFTGEGITVCFIDSGFFPHPDLVYPTHRIRHWHNVSRPGLGVDALRIIRPASWHGTMTAVVAAGSGYLSGGFYRGIASQAGLVFLGVADERGAIRGEAIEKALRWVLENYRRYSIRVVNVSVADDDAEPVANSPVSQAVEELAAVGVLVVAAVGNTPGAAVYPPASAPSALSIGGLNDQNTLDPVADLLYRSTYGPAPDANWKPELVAPAIWLAGPILPGTPQQEEAAALFTLWQADDWNIKPVLARNLSRVELSESLLEQEPPAIRKAVADRISRGRYISPHYQHIDGTSFAAPIVASVAAQMMESNPELTAATIKEILLSTARPLPGLSRAQQGFGVVQPLHAVNQAASENHYYLPPLNPVIDHRQGTITFHFHDHQAESVALSGTFNQWSPAGMPMKEESHGHWVVSFPLPPPGIYHYKFIVDGNDWRTDPRNLYRDPDGFNGFNSKFFVE